MTTLQSSPSDVRSADLLRQVGVLASAVIGIVVAFLGSGAVVGTPVDEVADGALSTSATFVAPAENAFAIWSVIYVGLAAFAVFQALPSRRHDVRQREVGWLVAASLLLNAVWILTVQAEWLVASVAVIVVLLTVLVAVMVRLSRSRPTSVADAILVDGSTGLYLGWVCIATVANTAATLVYLGVDATGDAATVWAVLVLVVAAIVGVVLAVASGGRLAPAVGLAWGLAWVAVARTEAPESTPVAVAAALASGVTIGAALFVRTRRPRSRPPSEGRA
jgi:hypothetical protein